MAIKAPPLGKIKSVPIPSQNLHIDPRGQTSYRAKGSYIAQGETIALKRNNVVKKIVSLVQLKPNIQSDKASIILDLGKILPPYMLPADIKIIDTIPLNQNGKSDKKLLTKVYMGK